MFAIFVIVAEIFDFARFGVKAPHNVFAVFRDIDQPVRCGIKREDIADFFVAGQHRMLALPVPCVEVTTEITLVNRTVGCLTQRPGAV